MSGWQDDVLGTYLETVTERGFDGPFIAYLSAAGFTDIHLLHVPSSHQLAARSKGGRQ